MNVLILIPARYASTRFPGKPLAEIGGKPMIQHVVKKHSWFHKTLLSQRTISGYTTGL